MSILLLFPVLGFQQRPQQPPSRKPVLIRADEEPEAKKVQVHDPAQAKASVKIGDFYFKKGNYKAAAGRYEEAIGFNLQWPTSYEKLAKAKEKLEDFVGAAEVCQQFLDANPESKKRDDFEQWKRKYQAEAEKP